VAAISGRRPRLRVVEEIRLGARSGGGIAGTLAYLPAALPIPLPGPGLSAGSAA